MDSSESTKLPATTDDLLPASWEGWTVEVIEGEGLAYLGDHIKFLKQGMNLAIQCAHWFNAVLDHRTLRLRPMSPAEMLRAYRVYVPTTRLERKRDGSLEFTAGWPHVTVRLRPPPEPSETGGPPAAPPR